MCHNAGMTDATADSAYFTDLPDISEIRAVPADEATPAYAGTVRLSSGAVIDICDGTRRGTTVLTLTNDETGLAITAEMTEVETNRVRSTLFQAQG